MPKNYLFIAFLSVFIPVNAFADKAYFKDLCKGIDNSYKCAQVIEDAQIPKFMNIVSRNKDELTFKFKNGKSWTFKNEEDKILYTFRDLLEIDYFLIQYHYTDGGGGVPMVVENGFAYLNG